MASTDYNQSKDDGHYDIEGRLTDITADRTTLLPTEDDQ